MNEIMTIPIDQLRHHPDNPRKDLGDLEELTASIKANGILQNLTVVFADPDQLSKEDQKCGYHLMWVVIGNRRFEAAKAAGLSKLPCVISEMDHKTQVATMLEENMQRQDLTVVEQAEGFQMMMELGFSEKQISEKTGFSAKTVKDRLKLAKMDRKHFSKAMNQGATLLDLLEVTKLESKEDQNRVLNDAGTDNFRHTMMSALRRQEFRKNKKRLEPVLKELGLNEIPDNRRYDSTREYLWNDDFKMEGTEDALRKAVKRLQRKIPKEAQLEYILQERGTDGQIEFRYKKLKTKAPMTEEQKTERQKAIARGKHLRAVQAVWEQAYALRKDFVKNYTVSNGQSASTIGKIMIRYALSNCKDYGGKLAKTHEWNDAYVRETLGLPEKPQVKPGADPKNSWESQNFLSIWDQVDGKSDIPIVRVILAWAVGGGIFWPDSPEHGCYDRSDGRYQKNAYKCNGVKELYEFLMECGYQLSDMERQLLDGTHECYLME